MASMSEYLEIVSRGNGALRAVMVKVEIAGVLFRHSVMVPNDTGLSDRAFVAAAMPALMAWMSEMIVRGNFARIAE